LSNRPDTNNWRSRWYDIVFEADTPKGKAFDVILLIAILGSLIVLMLESVPSLQEKFSVEFRIADWFFTGIFTLEYILRLAIVKHKKIYATSFFGVIDLLSILPSFLAFVLSGGQFFMVIRSLRLIRVFRVLKMVRFLGEAKVLSDALRASRAKIIVFIIAVLCIVSIMGTIMFMVEGEAGGFKSIPLSIYWCIVTLTTVGYGDISPITPLGQLIASIIMIMGYGVIAVPTGIVSAEMSSAQNKKDQINNPPKNCISCNAANMGAAKFCNHCGAAF
jgi:voltage-gated potassium channel